MPKFTDIIKSIALQSGVSETEIKPLLENAAIGSIEIDDAISTKLTAPRLTIEAAKANPDLIKFFKATSLNGIDAEVLALATQMELGDDVVTELKSAENTPKKVAMLAQKIKDIESKKAAGTGDTKKLNEQLSDLNRQLLEAKTNLTNREAELNAGFERERIDWGFNSLLGTFNYALPKETPIEARIAFGRSLAEKAINEKGLKIVKENGTLVLKTSENTDYFENNIKVGFNDFIQKTLANNKVLSASGEHTPPGGPTPVIQTHTTDGNGKKVDTSEFMGAMDDALKTVG